MPVINLLIGFLMVCFSRCTIPNDNTLPFYVDANFTPRWISTDSKEYKKIHTIAPFTFINQNGMTIDETDFNDKIYVADFFFTSCGGICPKMTSNMAKIQEAFQGDDKVLFLSHSVTPEKDSVAVLREYARSVGAISGKWHFVTGPKEAIYTIARKSYFADEDLGQPVNDSNFLHSENLILVDKKRRIRGVYKGTMPMDVKRLIADISILKLEYQQ